MLPCSLQGAFYYLLGNLHPMFQSNLQSMHLLALVKSSLVSKYGLNQILEPIVTDVKKLESVSNDTVVPNFICSVYICELIDVHYLEQVQCSYAYRAQLSELGLSKLL